MRFQYRFIFFILIGFLVFSCKETLIEKVEDVYEDGAPKLIRFYKAKDDKKILVKEKALYPDGKVQLEGGYKDDMRDGLWTFYYENGKKWSEASYKNGEYNGASTTWFENGQKRYEGFYANGNKTGQWKFWDESGKLVKEVDFSDK